MRSAVRAAYLGLRELYPAGMPSRNSCVISRFSHGTFKEGFIQSKALQADIVACAIDGSENCHIMGALPTGYGKSCVKMILAVKPIPHP